MKINHWDFLFYFSVCRFIAAVFNCVGYINCARRNLICFGLEISCRRRFSRRRGVLLAHLNDIIFQISFNGFSERLVFFIETVGVIKSFDSQR